MRQIIYRKGSFPRNEIFKTSYRPKYQAYTIRHNIIGKKLKSVTGGTIIEYQAGTDYLERFKEGYKEGYNEEVKRILERLTEMNKLTKEEAEHFARQYTK